MQCLILASLGSLGYSYDRSDNVPAQSGSGKSRLFSRPNRGETGRESGTPTESGVCESQVIERPGVICRAAARNAQQAGAAGPLAAARPAVVRGVFCCALAGAGPSKHGPASCWERCKKRRCVRGCGSVTVTRTQVWYRDHGAAPAGPNDRMIPPIPHSLAVARRQVGRGLV